MLKALGKGCAAAIPASASLLLLCQAAVPGAALALAGLALALALATMARVGTGCVMALAWPLPYGSEGWQVQSCFWWGGGLVASISVGRVALATAAAPGPGAAIMAAGGATDGARLPAIARRRPARPAFSSAAQLAERLSVGCAQLPPESPR